KVGSLNARVTGLRRGDHLGTVDQNRAAGPSATSEAAVLQTLVARAADERVANSLSVLGLKGRRRLVDVTGTLDRGTDRLLALPLVELAANFLRLANQLFDLRNLIVGHLAVVVLSGARD